MSESTSSSPVNGQDGTSHAPSSNDVKPEASLVDLLLIVLRNGRLILVTVAIFGILGLLIAIFSTSEYTASATVIRESETEGAMGAMGGLSLLRGIGLNLGSGSMGLTAEAYPDILLSREVRLAVARDTFYFSELGKSTSFTEYATRQTLMGAIKRNTIRLPGRILESMSSSTASPGPSSSANDLPSRPEEIAMKVAKHLVTTTVDPDTGLMTVSITSNDASLSADLASSFVRHLVTRVEEVRTQKARQNLSFVKMRFQQAEDSLNAAENALAYFNDRNTNPQSARLRTEQARLQRKVTFKSELYSDLQTQLTQAEIDLERSRPVITTLEEPVPPIDPSGPSRLLIVITGLMLGGVIGIGIAFTRALVHKLQQQEEDKLEEIKAALTPGNALMGMLLKLRPRKLES